VFLRWIIDPRSRLAGIALRFRRLFEEERSTDRRQLDVPLDDKPEGVVASVSELASDIMAGMRERPAIASCPAAGRAGGDAVAINHRHSSLAPPRPRPGRCFGMSGPLLTWACCEERRTAKGEQEKRQSR